MRTPLILGFMSVLAALAFVVGRGAGTQRAPLDEGTAVAAVPSTGGGDAASGWSGRTVKADPKSDRASDQSVLRALTASDLASTELEHLPTEETPAATTARRQETRERLARELGNISEELKGQLVDFNDRAIAFQRRLTGKFEEGQISHEEYMNQFHEEMLVQLAELHVLLNDDQYRIMTGLQPGVDPYDYMVAGTGGAIAETNEEEPLTEDQARPDKQHGGAR
jgi:hypothetical protein